MSGVETRVVRIGSGRVVVYEDSVGDGPVVVALHGTFGRGAVFGRLAAELGGVARVVAPDQRGHGRTGGGGPFGRAEFVADVAGFLRAVNLGPVVLVGHSLGGLNAFQVAARWPGLVRGVVVLDMGAELSPDCLPGEAVVDARGWPRRAGSRAELERELVARGVPMVDYFLLSAVDTAAGCELLFDWDELMGVQYGAVGDHWDDWLAVEQPILLVRGEHSPLLPAGLAAEMVLRRPGTRLVEVPGAGHWVHDDQPELVARLVADFVGEVCAGSTSPAIPGSTLAT